MRKDSVRTKEGPELMEKVVEGVGPPVMLMVAVRVTDEINPSLVL